MQDLNQYHKNSLFIKQLQQKKDLSMVYKKTFRSVLLHGVRERTRQLLHNQRNSVGLRTQQTQPRNPNAAGSPTITYSNKSKKCANTQSHEVLQQSKPVIVYSYGYVPFVRVKNPKTDNNDAESKNDNIRVLILRSKRGYWDFTKGTEYKSDESHIDTANREFKEETGIDPQEAIINTREDVYWDYEYPLVKQSFLQHQKTSLPSQQNLLYSVPPQNINNHFQNVNHVPSSSCSVRIKKVRLYLCELNPEVMTMQFHHDPHEIFSHEWVKPSALPNRFTFPEDNEVAHKISKYFAEHIV